MDGAASLIPKLRVRFELSHGSQRVRDVGRVLSMYIGPDDVLVTMDLDFDDGTAAVDAAEAIAAVERQVHERYPMIKRLFIEARAAPAPQRWTRRDSTQAPANPQ